MDVIRTLLCKVGAHDWHMRQPLRLTQCRRCGVLQGCAIA